jgi:hypothetical protein
MYIQVFQSPLYWILFAGVLVFLILVVRWFAYRSQEYGSQEPFNPNAKSKDESSFTVEDLNIQISLDDKSLTIPNTIKVIDDQPLNIVGGITTTKATVSHLTSTTSDLGQTTATTVNIGNAQLTNQNGLTLNTNLQCPQATITGDLLVNGNICIERDGHRWYLVSRGGYLHIVKNDTNLANDYNHRNNEPHVIIAPDGNIWTSRQNFAGWIGDNLNWIRSLGV